MTIRHKNTLIVCNAPLPPARLLNKLMRPKPFIICADGGANHLFRRGIKPDYIVGDLDSVSQQCLKALPASKIIRIQDQNKSDLEKALDFALDRGIDQVTVIGATGRRPDHTLANFSILQKYHDKMRIEFVDAYCSMRLISGETVLNLKKGITLSLMPMGRCNGIYTEGLAFQLYEESLQLGVREGLSNVVCDVPVRIRIRQGYLLLFVVHKR